MYQAWVGVLLGVMKRYALLAALPLLLATPSADAKVMPPHACNSHSAKVVAAKCADRNGDGRVEYLPDGTTR